MQETQGQRFSLNPDFRYRSGFEKFPTAGRTEREEDRRRPSITIQQRAVPIGLEPDSQIVRPSQPMSHQRLGQRPRMIGVVFLNARATDDTVHIEFPLSATFQLNPDMSIASARTDLFESPGHDLQGATGLISLQPLANFGRHPMTVRLPIFLQMAQKSFLLRCWKLLPYLVRDGTQTIHDGPPTQIRLARRFDVGAHFLHQQSKIAPVPQNWRLRDWNLHIMDLRQNPPAGQHIYLTSHFLTLQREHGIHRREAGSQKQDSLTRKAYM